MAKPKQMGIRAGMATRDAARLAESLGATVTKPRGTDEYMFSHLDHPTKKFHRVKLTKKQVGWSTAQWLYRLLDVSRPDGLQSAFHSG